MMGKIRKITKCEQAKELIRKRMKYLSPGEPLPSEPHLAREYGVSRFTISKAISELSAQFLLYRIQGKGTFVRERQAKEETNIQIICDRSSSFRSSNPLNWFTNFYILQGIVDGCTEFNCRANVVDIDSKISSINNKSQGIIAVVDNLKLIENLRKRNYIVVPYTPAKIKCNKVTVDWQKAAYDGVTHLLKLGHKRIGFIGSFISIRSVRLRYMGYRKAIEEKGISFREELTVECKGRKEDGYSAVLHLLKLKEKPTAVFAATDLIALGAINALKEKGLRVPEDIAVVGYDDIPEASSCNPSLTTLHPPRYECGYKAVKLLRQLINKEKSEPQIIILPTKLIIRKSCGAHLKDKLQTEKK